MTDTKNGGGCRVAVIAAHPDDEVLGCGATIACHVAAGDAVHVFILSEGSTARKLLPGGADASTAVAERAKAAQQAHAILGSATLELLNFPDNRLDGVDLLDLVKAIETFIKRVQPSVVYTHHPGDLNVDHRQVSDAVATTCRPAPGSAVERLLFFEVPSSTEWRVGNTSTAFVPNYFVDVAVTLERKLQALACYTTEIRPWPHPRSLQAVEHLARWRGATVACQAAEAFVLARLVVR